MKKLIFTIAAAVCAVRLTAQDKAEFGAENIPLKKVTLYSSGVAHYLHEGRVSGSGAVELLFSPKQINDVLKSLTIADTAASNLSVRYQSEDTLRKTLESLKVNLAASASVFDILKAQQGAELTVFTPHQINGITGTILSVDKNRRADGEDFVVSLSAWDGVHLVPFADIQSFRFTDEKRNEDLNAALALILDASAQSRKKIRVQIDAEGERNIKLSYIMEAPVWKASYRLNAASGKASFQAWAIVDNSTDLDWKNITLTLTTGRPVGFTQNLFAPYYTDRPELPLAIAEAAQAETFASGVAKEYVSEERASSAMRSRSLEKRAMAFELSAASPDTAYDEAYADMPEGAAALESSVPPAYFENQAAAGSAGEMFAFTPAKPVSLERQQSMMIPLTLASMPAEKFSVFSSIPYGTSVNPKFCIRIENTSGLKLPAGPVTVFDGGEYVGDALLEFLPENEKRLIAYGDDIEVSGTKSNSTNRNIETVTIAGGILSILYKQVQTAVYSVKNTDVKERTVIIEHAKKAGFELAAAASLTETTADKYRFTLKVAGGSNTELKIEESRIYRNEKKLFEMDSAAFVSYAANSELPDSIKKAFEAIIKEKDKVAAAQKIQKDVQDRRTDAAREQGRVRENLEAVGAETQQGKAFLDKLLTLESELDTLKTEAAAAAEHVKTAQEHFAAFIKGLKVE
ncbi:MAG: DUF4139 domain-containing protein [Treponema sp.]